MEHDDNQPQQSLPVKKRSILKITLFSLFLLIILVVVFAGWILSTESGLNFLVAQGQRWAPGTLRVETFQGRLIDHFRFTGLSYQHGELSLSIASFQLTWEAKALLTGQVHIQQLHLDRIEATLPPSRQEDTPSPSGPLTLPDIHLPVSLALDEVQITQVKIHPAQKSPLLLDEVILRSTTTEVLSLQQFDIHSPQLQAHLTGEIGLTSPHHIQLHFDWSTHFPHQPTLAGYGELKGDERQLTLDHNTKHPLDIQWHATVNDWLGQVNWTTKLAWKKFSWASVTSPQGELTSSGNLDQYHIHLATQIKNSVLPSGGSLELTAQGNKKELTIQKLQANLLQGHILASGQVAWHPALTAQLHLKSQDLKLRELWKPWPEQFSLDNTMHVRFQDNNLIIETLYLHIPQTATHLSLQSEGLLLKPNLQLKTSHLTWKNLVWPLDKATVQSPQGEANFSGHPQKYRFDLKAYLSGAKIPQGQWQLTGQGTTQQATIEKLSAKILTGQLNGQGYVAWKPKLNAQLQLHANHLNFKELWSPWPESIQANSEVIANLIEDQFELSRFTLRTPQTHITLQGKGTLRPTLTFDTQLTWQGLQWPLLSPALMTSPQGEVKVIGSIQKYQLQFTTHLAGPRIPSQQIKLTGEGNLQQFQLTSFQNDLLEGYINATGQVDWSSGMAVQLQLDAKQLVLTELWKDWPSALKLHSHLQASLKGKKFEIHPWQLSIPKNATQVSLQGEGSLDTQMFQVRLSWDNLQWPLSTSLIKSPQGLLQAEGSPNAYQIQLSDILVQGKDLPESRWQASGTGDQKHFQLHHLTGNLLKGSLDLNGQAQWNPTLAWEIDINGQKINPGSHWSNWPGQLSLALKSQGEIHQGQVQAQIDVQQFQGKLRQYPFALQSHVRIAGKDYFIEKFDFRSGRAYLLAKGELGTSSQLNWDLNFPRLSDFLPEAQGSLVSQGELSGSWTEPHLILDLEGKSLGYQDKQLKHLQAHAQVQNRQDLSFDLTATDGQSGTLYIKQLHLTTQGRVDQHQFTTDIVLPQDRISLALQGGVKQKQWEGQLQHLTVTTEKMGTWQLQKPASMHLSASEAFLELFCLTHTSSAFCAKFHWKKAGETRAQARLEKLPLNLVKAFSRSIEEANGMLEGNLEMTLGEAIQLDSTLTLSPGFIKVMMHDELERFTHQGGHVQLHIDPQEGLKSQFDFRLLKQSHLQGEFRLPKLTRLPLPTDQTVQGNIQGQFEDMHILPTLVPQAEHTQGKASLEVALEGPLKMPKIQGEIRLHNASTELPSAGLELKDINMLIKDAGQNRLILQASLRSGQGTLKMEGDAQFPSLKDWKATVNLTGKNFEAVNTPVVWALISPEIRFQLAPQGINVNGKVIIPEAMITPTKAASGAVTSSEDIVMADETQLPSSSQESPKLPLSSDITLTLGDKVSFKGAGFKSRLAGTLQVKNQPHKLAVGNGELYIVEGTYKAYGQNLKVDKGRVIFAGGPMDNPGLDIRAFRTIHQKSEDDIIAGVHIQGTAKLPDISLYSIPSQDQSNILSYIMLGKPLNQASQAEGKSLLGAAVASQFEGEGESLTQKMAQQFGLDEAAISSEGGIEKSELVVGKYLSPDLYIGYGVGLFDASTVFRIRYFLTRRLTLETETGTQSGADLRYHFER